MLRTLKNARKELGVYKDEIEELDEIIASVSSENDQLRKINQNFDEVNTILDRRDANKDIELNTLECKLTQSIHKNEMLDTELSSLTDRVKGLEEELRDSKRNSLVALEALELANQTTKGLSRIATMVQDKFY